MKKPCYALVLGASLFCVAAANLPAQDAPAPAATAVRIAIVDWAKLGQAWTLEIAESEAFYQWFTQRDQLLKELSRFTYLTESEFAEILRIYEQPPPWSAEDERLRQELQESNDARALEYDELKNTIDRTDQQQRRWRELSDMFEARRRQLVEVKQGMEADVDKRRKDLVMRLLDTKKQVTQQVAQGGGYTLVLAAEVVVFGGDDITEQVVAALNRDHPAPEGGGEAEGGGEPEGGAGVGAGSEAEAGGEAQTGGEAEGGGGETEGGQGG